MAHNAKTSNGDPKKNFRSSSNRKNPERATENCKIDVTVAIGQVRKISQFLSCNACNGNISFWVAVKYNCYSR